MNPKTPPQPPADLVAEVAELRAQLTEAKETLEAIRTGAVDAIVVSGPAGERVFSLEGAETPYRSLVEEINEGALLLRPDGIILYANACFAQLADTPLERVIGSPCRRFLPPADHSRLETLLQAARRGGLREEFSLQAQAGAASRPVEVSLSLLKGTQAETLSAIVTDLTERKRVEEARAKLATIVESSEDAIASIGLDGMVRSWNPAAERLYGYRAEEIIGQPIALIIPPERRGEETRTLERLRQGEHIAPYETVRATRDGRRIDVLVTLSPLRNLAGTIVGASKIIRDITAHKQAEERQAALLAEVQTANANLQDFATIVSHDLKTPLRGMATLAKWLQSDYADKLDEEGREHLAEMIKRTDRMNRMIDDILQYSRAGRPEEKTEPVPLAELVPAVIQDLAPPAHARVRIAPGLPVVQGEPVRLRQLFQNLIGNAIKYANKPQVEIHVGWADSDSMWRFTVADNGPGIEPRHFERIFMMFQTLAPKDKTDSTGVGLALVKRIVERAGGRVWVESHLGAGSTFHFTWPKRLRPGAALEAVERNERLAA